MPACCAYFGLAAGAACCPAGFDEHAPTHEHTSATSSTFCTCCTICTDCLLKDGLRHLDVHAHRAVNQLGDRHVAGDARQLVGLVLVHLPGGDEEVHHLL